MTDAQLGMIILAGIVAGTAVGELIIKCIKGVFNDRPKAQ